MAIRYRYDLYPADNPRDGARLVRFTKLQQASYRDVVGVGSGAFTIRSTESEADFLDPDGEQYVRVVREDTGDASALTVGGFWINKYHHKTADRNLTKRLVASGAGTMAYLARARMAPHSYFSEFHAFAAGQDPFDDLWRLSLQGEFAGGDFLGAVLWRVLMEASHFRSGATYQHVHADGLLYDDAHDDDRTESALPDMVLDFDQDTDSNGNAWTVPSGEFTAQVGESILSVVQRLMNAGLYVKMHPDTFVVSAYENAENRRDRTGSSWGTNVVRFQSPTDTTVDTGNMLSESERELESSVKRSLIWAGGQDVYEKATQASDVPWEGFESSDVLDPAALSQIASRQLSARNEAADKPKIRIKMGRSPTTGRYLPWEEVQIEDLVTVHTGSGEWDHDESTYPVAALRIELQRSGAWHGWAELGDSFGSAQSKIFSTATVGAHKHPPNPMLCDPTIPPGSASCAIAPSQLTEVASPNGDFETGLETNWTFDSIGANGVVGPGSGDWEGDYYATINGAGAMQYTGHNATVFNMGQTYAIRIRTQSANATTDLVITNLTNTVEYLRESVGSGDWQEHCFEWTPAATYSGVLFFLHSSSGLDNFNADDLRVYSGAEEQNPYNGQSNRAARCDHTHPAEEHDHDGEYAVIDHTHDLDDLTDVELSTPGEGDTLRYVDGEWINDNRRWEAVTDGEDTFVWEGDDLVHEWNGSY